MHSGGTKGTAGRQAAIASALRTVTTEQAGMAALAEALKAGLAEPFGRAVETLSVISGRVIVTGVGKSGHIGSKIAATLASTGTPAFFVHPSEANHGDLGMIARDDAIIALSWSGESFELKGIVSYARRFAIPLIAVTAAAALPTVLMNARRSLLIARTPACLQSALAPAALNTFARMTISPRTSLSNASGVLCRGTAPVLVIRSLTSGSCRIRPISLDSESTMVRGVRDGTKTPNHPSYSKPGRAASAIVGTSCNAGRRCVAISQRTG